MFGSAVTILIGAALVWTMPAGQAHDGAMAIIGLLGMGFNAIGIVYASVWAWRNRKTIREFIREEILGG